MYIERKQKASKVILMRLTISNRNEHNQNKIKSKKCRAR